MFGFAELAINNQSQCGNQVSLTSQCISQFLQGVGSFWSTTNDVGDCLVSSGFQSQRGDVLGIIGTSNGFNASSLNQSSSFAFSDERFRLSCTAWIVWMSPPRMEARI